MQCYFWATFIMRIGSDRRTCGRCHTGIRLQQAHIKCLICLVPYHRTCAANLNQHNRHTWKCIDCINSQNSLPFLNSVSDDCFISNSNTERRDNLNFSFQHDPDYLNSIFPIDDNDSTVESGYYDTG